MQRILSAFWLALPERDKLELKIRSRHNVSMSPTWGQAEQIVGRIRKMRSRAVSA